CPCSSGLHWRANDCRTVSGIVWGVKRGLRIEGSWTGARGARPGLWSLGGRMARHPQTTAVRRKEPQRSERSATEPARIAANDCTLPTEVDTDGVSHLRDDGRGLGGA